ncbi:AroM family protein [Lentibacillus sp. N15]|uniref:AroM family protein n=1 Tax=Lentibacillus songyuanensis TaxID=3136161 RepID=UPI0031BA08CC
MNKGIVGVLTIGQSPRKDVTPSIQSILGSEVVIKESGGLDSVTEGNMHEILPSNSDTTYISRLRNGESTKIGKSKLLPLLQNELSKLEEKVDVVIMLCTGDFPTLRVNKPILYPDRVLNHTMKAIMMSGSLGLVIPLEEQRHSLVEKWKDQDLELLIEVASPYEESDVAGAARALKANGADIIVLDCMGFNEQHKQDAIKGSGLPVILPRTLVARIAKEYVG